MPIPKPKKDEDKDAFISRCISTVSKEDPERSDKQIQAICFSTWKESREENEEDENTEETEGTGQQRVVISSKTR